MPRAISLTFSSHIHNPQTSSPVLITHHTSIQALLSSEPISSLIGTPTSFGTDETLMRRPFHALHPPWPELSLHTLSSLSSNPAVKAFLLSPQPTTLILSGAYSSYKDKSYSPMTTLSMSLIWFFRDRARDTNTPDRTLFYFAAAHAPSSLFYGSKGLLLTLLLQLLNSDREWLREHEDMCARLHITSKRVEDMSLRDACCDLTSVLEEMPGETCYTIVLDGLERLTDGETDRDLSLVFKELLGSLMSPERRGVKLKVAVSSCSAGSLPGLGEKKVLRVDQSQTSTLLCRWRAWMSRSGVDADREAKRGTTRLWFQNAYKGCEGARGVVREGRRGWLTVMMVRFVAYLLRYVSWGQLVRAYRALR